MYVLISTTPDSAIVEIYRACDIIRRLAQQKWNDLIVEALIYTTYIKNM